MKRGYCYGCSYFQELDYTGKEWNYCSDKDCRVDPTEPDCNFD